MAIQIPARRNPKCLPQLRIRFALGLSLPRCRSRCGLQPAQGPSAAAKKGLPSTLCRVVNKASAPARLPSGVCCTAPPSRGCALRFQSGSADSHRRPSQSCTDISAAGAWYFADTAAREFRAREFWGILELPCGKQYAWKYARLQCNEPQQKQAQQKRWGDYIWLTAPAKRQTNCTQPHNM